MNNNIDKAGEVSRRRFLKRAAILSGLLAGGGLTLAACGETPTITSTPVPTATSAPVATPVPATPATTIALSPTKAAANPTPVANSKPDPNFVEIGVVKDFAGIENQPKLIELDAARVKKQASVFIVKQGESYKALSNICPHQGCEIDWVGELKNFQCPCHGSQFDLEGNNVVGPALLPLAQYATKIENGKLLVSLKKRQA